MNAAMDVGVVVLVVMNERIDDRARFLGSGRVVEINQRMAMHLLVQDRKVGSNFLEFRGSEWSALVHWTNLHQTELQPGRVAHHALVPNWIPNDFDVHIADA